MVALYLFSLVLGGGFLAFSVLGDLLGGHIGDADFDADFDAHLDTGDLDLGGADADLGGLDADVAGVDMDADAGGFDHGVDADTAHATHAAAKIFSLRSAIYTLFGFGAVGSLLTWIWGGDAQVLTAGFAVLGGLLSGATINLAFGYVRRSESGAQLPDASLEGLSGSVTLPLATNAAGRIVVEQGGRRVALRALPHPSAAEEAEPDTWRNVLVVEMKDGVAYVVPAEDDLLLES